MSGLGRQMKLRSYAINLTPTHLYLMAFWAKRISKQMAGQIEADELVQDCWMAYGRYCESIKGCSYAIKAHMWRRAQRIRPRGCGLFIKVNPILEINHTLIFDESDEHKFRRATLDAMLSALDDRTQVIFQLHINGLNWRQIGYELELSGERVRQLFLSGLKQLLPRE
jgi:DNA-directed RNA polymerase specialized sigma24 family protein